MPNSVKQCSVCLQPKELTEANFRRRKNKLRSDCRACENKARMERGYSAAPTLPPILGPEPVTQPDIAADLICQRQVTGAPKVERVLFIPDTHAPYHDAKAFAIMLHAASLFKPHTIVILGDFQDFYCVSSHDKNPMRVKTLKDEIAEGNKLLTLVDKLGARRKIYICGNHEQRLDRYIARCAPALYGSTSIAQALDLDKRGWRFVPYRQGINLGPLYVTHDIDHAGKYSLFHTMGDIGANFVIGHTHRFGVLLTHDSLGKPSLGAMFGWLGDFDSIDYQHKMKSRRDWAHGFGLGYIYGNTAHIVPVPILNNSCVVEGTLVTI